MGILSNQRYDTGASVKEVALRHEFGTRTIPARPFLRPAYNKNIDKWKQYIYSGLQSGKSLDTILNAVGSMGVGEIKREIASIVDPPLKKARKDGGTKPLVDTGLLLSSVTYEVEIGLQYS